MIESLISYLNQYIGLNAEETQFLKERVPVKSSGKGAFLLKDGEVSREFFYLIKGCVRLFYWVDGEEKTAFFYTENSFVSSYQSYVKQQPANHNLQCLEDSIVAVFDHSVASELLAFSPKFELLARTMMEEELIVYQDIIASFVSNAPEERYQRLVATNPELVNRIPQYQLASFLGVRPESLSRIRKRLAAQ